MPYQHIFFDLDHTLWDFERNAAEALEEIFTQFELHQYGNKSSMEQFLEVFYETNHELWLLYDRNLINADTLRDTRFKIIFEKLNIPENRQLCDALSETYGRISPRKPHLIPHALEVLEYLQHKYRLHIISNGFAEIQFIKLEKSGIHRFFDQIVTPELVGAKKPSKEIFDFILGKIQAQCSDCLMIGDSLETDIQGAKNAGLDHIFFNPKSMNHQESVHYEIQSLKELMHIL